VDGEITRLIKQGENQRESRRNSRLFIRWARFPPEKRGYRIGKERRPDADKIRIAIADACRGCGKKGVKHIETVLIGAGG